MKIAIYSTQVIPSNPDLKQYGGLELIAGLQAKYFAEQGHEVHLFATKNSYFSTDKDGKKPFENGFLYAVGDPGKINPMDAWKTYWNDPKTKQVLKDADIICDHSWNYYPYSVYNELKNICHVHHGPDPGFNPQNKPPTPKPNLIAVSHNHAKQLTKQSGITFRGVENGIDLNNYPFQKEKGDYFLWLSRIYPFKGTHRFIDICNKAKVKGIIAGGSFGDERQYVDQIKTAISKSEYVTAEGQIGQDSISKDGQKGVGVSHEKKVELYQNAKAIVIPSIETLPSTQGGMLQFIEPFGLITCLPPYTKIITLDNIKEIKDIKQGDKVLTHKGRFKSVLKVSKRAYKGQIIEIKPYGNEPIRLTPEHQIFTLGEKIEADNFFGCTRKLGWKAAQNVKKGDIVVFPKPNRIFRKKVFDLSNFDNVEKDGKYVWYKFAPWLKVKRWINIDEDLCFLLGWYIAEGSINYIPKDKKWSSAVEYSLGEHEKDIGRKILNTVNKLFEINGIMRNYTKTRTRVIFSSKILGKFFEELCGKGAKNKKIPLKILYHRNKKLLRTLVDAAQMGDGCYYENSTSYATISTNLAYQMKIALARLDERPMISIRENNGGFYSENPLYTINNTNYGNRKKHHSNKAYWITKGHLAYFIKEVKEIPYDGQVYNLVVEDDQSYTTSSFTVHNCEANACGTPCIVLPSGGWHETMTHGLNGFFANSDDEFIYYMKRIEEINPEDCRKVAEHFSYQRMGSEYLKLFKEIIENKGW